MLLNSEPVSEDAGKLLLRLAAGGGLLMQHGWPKVAGFTARMDDFYDPFGLGPAFSLGLMVFAETVCAAMVLAGIWTRLATVPVMIGMAVAAFVVTHGDPLGKGELASIYLLAYGAIFLMGSGRFALDRMKFS